MTSIIENKQVFNVYHQLSTILEKHPYSFCQEFKRSLSSKEFKPNTKINNVWDGTLMHALCSLCGIKIPIHTNDKLGSKMPYGQNNSLLESDMELIEEIFFLLIRSGVDVNEVNGYNETPYECLMQTETLDWREGPAHDLICKLVREAL
jgi:hypothetical protein